MTETANALDALTRRVIRAAEEDLRRSLGPGRLDNDLLGALYLRVREALERSAAIEEAAVDDIALTIYLTASAWSSRGEPPLKLLSSLHQVVGKTVAGQIPQQAPAGARRTS